MDCENCGCSIAQHENIDRGGGCRDCDCTWVWTVENGTEPIRGNFISKQKVREVLKKHLVIDYNEIGVTDPAMNEIVYDLGL